MLIPFINNVFALWGLILVVRLPWYRHVLFNLFPHITAFWHLKQMAIENNVTNGEIAHNEQFLHLPQCFQLFSAIIPAAINTDFPYFPVEVFNVVCFRFVVYNVGKSYIRIQIMTWLWMSSGKQCDYCHIFLSSNFSSFPTLV